MIRFVIVNGDDFGLSPGINRGIIEAHRKGILTSASLMATGDAFEGAVELARMNSGLAIGVHLNLVEGAPILPPAQVPSLLMSNGRFLGSRGGFLARLLTGRIRLQEVEAELEAQVRKVLDRGIKINKLDSHMHLHLFPGVLQTVLAVAKRHQIGAIRLPTGRVIGRGNLRGIRGWLRRTALTSLSSVQARPIAEAGLFYPDFFSAIAKRGPLTEEDLLRVLQHLKPGVTELMAHPGYRDADPDRWSPSCHYDRERELKVLISPRVKDFVEKLGIKLINYQAVPSKESADLRM